jgi:hypothetical protein
MDVEKANAEPAILRKFIDFVNRQVGVYCDCLAGFLSNKMHVERQLVRRMYPESTNIDNGAPLMVMTSVEDPNHPMAVHIRIIPASDFIKDNSEAKFNERQICWSIIVFIFAYRDEEIRPSIAIVRSVEPNSIKIDALGDLRLLRKCIVHNGSVLSLAQYERMEVLKDVCQPDSVISPIMIRCTRYSLL